MDFEFKAIIHRPRPEVFAFFRDVERYAGRPGTRVPVLDRTTPEPVGVGTRYHEVVQVLPCVTGQVFTEVTGFEPDSLLAYRFVALGMRGELTYRFREAPGGTEVLQQQSLHPSELARLFSPFIKVMFSRQVARRLEGIKALLEGQLEERLPPSPQEIDRDRSS